MGIQGKQSKKGEGEKEPDGSVRNAPLKIRIPRWKLLRLKSIALRRKISLTDLVSEIIGIFLSRNTEDSTQRQDDIDEG